MLLEIPDEIMPETVKQAKTVILKKASSSNDFKVDHRLLDPADWKLLRDLAEKEVVALEEIHPSKRPYHHGQLVKNLRGLARTVRGLIKVQRGGVEQGYAALPALAEAMRILVTQWKKPWVFLHDHVADVYNPYQVTGINYIGASKTRNGYFPAHIVVTGEGIDRGSHERVSKTFWKGDSDNPTADEAFRKIGYFVPSDELLAEYDEWMEKYNEMKKKHGVQLMGAGHARVVTQSESRWYRSETVQLINPHEATTRLILDDDEDWGTDADAIHTEYVNVTPAVVEELEEDEEVEISEEEVELVEQQAVLLPVHPYVRAFSLSAHTFFTIHINQVDQYAYQRGLFDKVILDPMTKNVIEALASPLEHGEMDNDDDLIAGKGKGTILVMSGPAGLGKTLTAETYAERARRPLYTVQCAQLGTDPDKLEAELATVLARATKWRCILLLDEADVYIQARGRDIAQNAIVGVFLRLLEYYRGIIFMNTNRTDEIDEAILSRALVHFRFTKPSPDELTKLWHLMADQFHVDMKEALVDELVERFPRVSGRTIKQVMRVVKILSIKKIRPVAFATFEYVLGLHTIKAKDAQDK